MRERFTLPHEALSRGGADVTLEVRDGFGHGLNLQSVDQSALSFFRRTL